MTNQDWLTFDALMGKTARVCIEEKIDSLLDAATAAQGTSKNIKRRVKQLRSALKKLAPETGSVETKKAKRPPRKGLRDFMDAVRGSGKKEGEGGGR